jgi:hypothetical protein
VFQIYPLRNTRHREKQKPAAKEYYLQKKPIDETTKDEKIFFDIIYPDSGSCSRRIPSISGKNHTAPAIAGVTMMITATNTAQFALENYTLYNTGQKKAKIYKKIKNVRILGLMAVISYMTVILFVWIYANYDGYVYFLAGEPNLLIKYTEWLLGFIGIFVTIDLLRKEIKYLE